MAVIWKAIVVLSNKLATMVLTDIYGLQDYALEEFWKSGELYHFLKQRI
jgi:hypothetical protein